jgi:hypothetical protein
MKRFVELREAKAGKTVFNKREKGIPVKIVKDSSGYSVYIDGDFLDTYKSEPEAKKSAMAAIKELT